MAQTLPVCDGTLCITQWSSQLPIQLDSKQQSFERADEYDLEIVCSTLFLPFQDKCLFWLRLGCVMNSTGLRRSNNLQCFAWERPNYGIISNDWDELIFQWLLWSIFELELPAEANISLQIPNQMNWFRMNRASHIPISKRHSIKTSHNATFGCVRIRLFSY